LLLFYGAGIAGDGKTRGANHFGHKGLLRMLYCGNNSMAPRFGSFVGGAEFPAYMAPQGALIHLMRAASRE
jgi:propionate CoA-transferase